MEEIAKETIKISRPKPEYPPEKIIQIKQELSNLANRYSFDTALDMPDYLIGAILCEFLMNCITAHEANIAWHNGRVL